MIPKLEDYVIHGPQNISDEKITAHIIGGLEHSLITDHIIEQIPIEDNQVVIDYSKNDLAYFFLLDRYGLTDHFSKALVKGFKFNTLGAFASTVAHDSHQLIVTGNDSECMNEAVKNIVSNNGGLAIVHKNSSDKMQSHSLPLPYAGLMSIDSPFEVAKKFKTLKRQSNDLTSGISEPFMALSFMALPVIPKLKLTDRGIVDVEKFQLIELFEI